jgi:ABC-type branched-subunit amino acid transport system substrate-binding protein
MIQRTVLRDRILSLITLSTVFALTACNEPQEPGNTQGITTDSILIGSSSALTGHAGFLGSQYTLGSKAWFSEVNAAGGIHGRKIKLLTLDDQYEPEQTVSNTKKLIFEDQVFMLFGYVGTPTSVRIIDLVHDANIPAFGFFTGAEALRTPYRPNIFHVRASYYSEAEGAVEYFVDLTGVQLALRKRGMEVLATDTYTRGSLELERPVRTIGESGAEAVILVGTYSPLAKFIKNIHESGHSPYFHTVSFVGSEAFAESILEQNVDSEQFDRIIVTQVVPSPESGELGAVTEYREHLAKHFPDEIPNYVSLEGYINARVLTQILKFAGRDLDRKILLETLESTIDLNIGVGKSISYGPFDHNGFSGIFYSRLEPDGHFRIF